MSLIQGWIELAPKLWQLGAAAKSCPISGSYDDAHDKGSIFDNKLIIMK